jgi:hypothetical protein
MGISIHARCWEIDISEYFAAKRTLKFLFNEIDASDSEAAQS